MVHSYQGLKVTTLWASRSEPHSSCVYRDFFSLVLCTHIQSADKVLCDRNVLETIKVFIVLCPSSRNTTSCLYIAMSLCSNIVHYACTCMSLELTEIRQLVVLNSGTLYVLLTCHNGPFDWNNHWLKLQSLPFVEDTGYYVSSYVSLSRYMLRLLSVLFCRDCTSRRSWDWICWLNFKMCVCLLVIA